MLSLATHEPYFALLREKVVFQRRGEGKGRIRSEAVEGEFQYLSISLLRQYLELEYSGLNIPFGFDMEKIIGLHFWRFSLETISCLCVS